MPGVSDAGGMDGFEQEALQALRELGGQPPVTITLSPVLAFLVLSQLQLALRHPQNTGKSTDEVRRFFARLRAKAVPMGGVLDRVIEMGFDETFDVKAEGDRPQRKN